MPTLAFLTQLLLLGLSIFLMIVILLQRGRGGGLAGAFGGLGGQSAFGTKAGDVFTKVTIVVATLWVMVAGGSGWFLREGSETRAQGLPEQIQAGEDAEGAAGLNLPDAEGDTDFDPLDGDAVDGGVMSPDGETGAQPPADPVPPAAEQDDAAAPAATPQSEAAPETSDNKPAEPEQEAETPADTDETP